MAASSNWAFPDSLQPSPEDLRFELEAALGAVVMLRTEAPDDAFTASILGTERVGSGVVIGDNGLVLTIGYLITEAETIWLSANNGTLINFSPALTFTAGTWTKAPVKPDFDGFNDGDVVFTEELQLREDALTAANANLVLAVDIGGVKKQARLTVPPNGLDRFWRFALTPMQ